ncbi:hypothetical protein APHAL10511_004927 [Amanita phalloides]|nr:hypothetical protein APHAL10511_004927 [Amanita phalloides]
MTFSGILTLTDLNDFITPSQACIKPVEPAKTEAGAAATEIVIDSSGSYYEVSSAVKQRKLEQAQINLNDCLACSGCITSAESVLITMQSHVEVLSFLSANENKVIPVLSIAPQSLASLAASLAEPTTAGQVLQRIRAFCTRKLGFAHVFDTTFARHVSLKEHIREYKERRAQNELPMIASACPGWICYAEKTHGEMLPFIAKTKSPQQMMGTLVKEWLGEKWGKKPNEIYHVTVMPCYDKKLEASRSDFYNEEYSIRDVDCVITTGEMELIMNDKGWDLSAAVEGEEDRTFPEMLRHQGSSSGSYLQTIMDHMAQTWPGGLKHSVKTIRNIDYEEHVLTEVDGGKVVFRGAKCYGFRNLQNVVRKVGRDKGVQVGSGVAGKLGGGRRMRREGGGGGGGEGYDYVEVMACPGGCVNGGGQLRSAPGGEKELRGRVEAVYWETGDGEADGEAERADKLAMTVMKAGLTLRTGYRAVESVGDGMTVKW